tara:strand:+ start:178 stop:297 length:120 start_codon:yes stop_codon:yes gene_type:complete
MILIWKTAKAGVIQDEKGIVLSTVSISGEINDKKLREFE